MTGSAPVNFGNRHAGMDLTSLFPRVLHDWETTGGCPCGWRARTTSRAQGCGDAGQSILLVDGDLRNRMDMREFLQDHGPNLVMAKSGNEALRCALRDDFAFILGLMHACRHLMESSLSD